METNGTTTGPATAPEAVATVPPPAPATALRPEWVRAAELAAELGKPARTVRKLVAATVAAEHQERRPRPDGGQAEVYLSPTAAAAVRGHYANGRNGTSNGATTGPGAVATVPPPAPATAPGAVDPAEGWRAALATVEAERDRLRSELQQAAVALQQARQHAEEAERGRHHAAEALASLRASVALWYGLLRRPLWRLRPLPPLPAEVTGSAPLLAKPED